MKLTRNQLLTLRREDRPFVRCLDCGRVGFDPADREKRSVSPCPRCGADEAEFALPFEDWLAIRQMV